MSITKRFVLAAIFSVLIVLATIVLVAAMATLAGLSDQTSLAIPPMIGLLLLVFLMRAPLPRLVMARGLMLFAVALATIPIQVLLVAFIGYEDVGQMSPTTGIAGLLDRISYWMTSVSAAIAAAGLALAAAPVLFIFGWAYATKGPDDTP